MRTRSAALLLGLGGVALYLCVGTDVPDEAAPARIRLREAHARLRTAAPEPGVPEPGVPEPGVPVPGVPVLGAAVLGAAVPNGRPPADGAPPKVSAWVATTRPMEGFAGWSPTIVGRTLLGLWASDAHLAISTDPGIDVAADGLFVSSGWYEYRLAWEDIEDVYSAGTNDLGNPEILCIKRTTGELLVLSDLAFGADTETIAATARDVREARAAR